MDNFPSRPLEPASEPFLFSEATARDNVARTFEGILGIGDFDAFLEEMETQAFLVIQDDAILYEKYFNGASRDSLLTSFSVAKSCISALVGSAIAEGYINSVDDPITDYLPELAQRDPNFSDITVRHLLLMAGGVGLQVLPTDWIADSTQVDPSTRNNGYFPDEFCQVLVNDLRGYYRYKWYEFLRTEGAADFAAEGDHGPFIYVFPEKDLIILRNGLEYGADW